MADSALNDRGCVYGVLIKDGRALALQRGKQRHYSYRWELPGGKLEIEDGEDCEVALRRECREEAGLKVRPVRPLGKYTFELDGRTVRKSLYLIEGESGTVALDGDHIAYAWLTPEDLQHYDFVPNIPDDIMAGFRAMPEMRAKTAVSA